MRGSSHLVNNHKISTLRTRGVKLSILPDPANGQTDLQLLALPIGPLDMHTCVFNFGPSSLQAYFQHLRGL